MAGLSYYTKGCFTQLFATTLLLTAATAAAVAAADDVQQPIMGTASCNTNVSDMAYGANVDSLLFALTRAAGASHFYKTTSGDDDSSRAYGLYQCHGYVSPEACKVCVTRAAIHVRSYCRPWTCRNMARRRYPPMLPKLDDEVPRRADLWYKDCLLRYSDSNFFGSMGFGAGMGCSHNQNVSDSPPPLDFISGVISQAPLQHPLMFASNYSNRHQRFGVAHCTGDITSQNCTKCLNEGLQEFKDFSNWNKCNSGCTEGYYLSPSCGFRYKATPFLQNVNFTGSIQDELPGLEEGNLVKDNI